MPKDDQREIQRKLRVLHYAEQIRQVVAGCSEAEIATITGHSMKYVGSILDAHYLHRDAKMAENAINKRERSLKTPN